MVSNFLKIKKENLSQNNKHEDNIIIIEQRIPLDNKGCCIGNVLFGCSLFYAESKGSSCSPGKTKEQKTDSVNI